MSRMLQIMYGNDRTNYRLIAKSPELSDDMEEKLYKAYKSYYMPAHAGDYSHRRYFPRSVSCSVSDLDRRLEEKQVILCLNAQMDNIQTPCTYFHGIIFQAGKDFFQEEFGRVFQYQFVSAQELMEYDGRDAGDFEVRERPLHPVKKISAEQMEAALLHFYGNELQNRETRWVLDVTGDTYNDRSLELLAAFYRYLPWQNRKSCGFITYCDERQRVSDRIRVRIFDRSQLRSLKGYFDWGSISDQRASREVRKFVEFLMNVSEQEKRSFEAELEEAFHGEEITASWAAEYYAISRVWREEEISRVFSSWKNMLMKYRWEQNRLYGLLLELMEERLTNEAFQELLLGELEQMNCCYSEMPWKVSTTLEAAELLPWIVLNTEKIGEWEFELLKRKQEEGKGSLEALLQEEIGRLERMTDQGEKQRTLRESIIRRLREELGEIPEQREKEPEEISEQKEKEPGHILEQMEKGEGRAPEREEKRRTAFGEAAKIPKIDSVVRVLQEKEVWELPEGLAEALFQMGYAENDRESYTYLWRELFSDKIEKLKWIRSEQEYQGWLDFLALGRNILGEEEYFDYLDVLKKRRAYLDSFKQASRIQIWEYRALENFYWSTQRRTIADNIIGRQEDRDFTVSFRDGREYILTPEELGSLVRYLLYKEGGPPEEIFLTHSGLVQSMLSSELFCWEHFQEMMTGGIDRSDKEKVMEYFLGKDGPVILPRELEAVMAHLGKNDRRLAAKLQEICKEKKKSPSDGNQKRLGKKANRKRG